MYTGPTHHHLNVIVSSTTSQLMRSGKNLKEVILAKAPSPSYWHVLAALIMGYHAFGVQCSGSPQNEMDYQSALERHSSLLRQRANDENNPQELAIVFPSLQDQEQRTLFQIPSQEMPIDESKSSQKDFGGLELSCGIQDDEDEQIRKTSKSPEAATDEYVPVYYRLKGRKAPTKFHFSTDCLDTNWEYAVKPVCNHMHELDLLQQHQDEFDVSFLGRGAWRNSYGFEKKSDEDAGTVQGEDDWSFVFRTMDMKKLEKVGSHKSDDRMKRDAVIMERLSASPRIVDIYGYCGISNLVEYMQGTVTDLIVPLPGNIPQKELDLIQLTNDNQVVPQNNLTSKEKLDMAIGMAESIATMHGFEGGVMLHSDIHLHQILLSKQGVLKLNDFDSSPILSYNTKTSEYCTTYECQPQVRFFSPEQVQCDGLGDEKMDVWALGTNIYLLLTGLWPFYEYEGFDLNIPLQLTPSYLERKNRQMPFVDERYRTKDFIHSKLVEIMELCWTKNSMDRISVFDVVTRLAEVKTRVAE